MTCYTGQTISNLDRVIPWTGGGFLSQRSQLLLAGGLAVILVITMLAFGQRAWLALKRFAGIEY